MTSRTPYDAVKRGVDMVVASAALLVSAPVQAVIAVLVRSRLGAPVLFRQTRPGRDEVPFELIKFRTMKAVDVERGLVTDEQRLTSLGVWLRATSLDELPTLWNVVRGDMSLVGPRPLLMQYLGRYSATQRRRHQVRPGVTGLAQVSGRNALTWEEKFAFDVEYVERRSWRLDLSIVVRTLQVTVSRKGISAHDDVTMPEFLGTSESSR